MRLAILADTHVPERADELPAPFKSHIKEADHTVHAGDFETIEFHQEISELANELTAVHGNADPAPLDRPAVAEVTIEGITFVVTHGTINPVEAAVFGHDAVVFTGEEWANAIADTARARTRAWDGQDIVGIGGHTHRVEDTTHDGVRILNPGSATGADPAQAATMMTVEVDGTEFDVTLHEE